MRFLRLICSAEIAVVLFLLACVSSTPVMYNSREGRVIATHRSVLHGEPIVSITVAIEEDGMYEQYTNEYLALSREAVRYGHVGACVGMVQEQLVPCRNKE